MKKAVCPPMRVQTTINLLGRECTVTDLSHPISPSDPTFGGHQRTVMWEHLTHEETIQFGLTKAPYSYKVTGFTMCDHSGTHMDAINHVVNEPDARGIDMIPLEWTMAPGVWFDFSHLEPNAYITQPMIEQAIGDMGVTIQQDSVALMHTGWYRKYNDPAEYIQNYPGLDRGACEYLNDLGVISFGADAQSVDSHHEVKTVRVQPAHIVCREREILNMENLANIDLIPKHEFAFIGLPLKFKEGSGSPIRAVAITED